MSRAAASSLCVHNRIFLYPTLWANRTHGVRYTGMAAWEGLLSDDETWKVVTFLSRLNHLPPRVAEQFRREQSLYLLPQFFPRIFRIQLGQFAQQFFRTL